MTWGRKGEIEKRTNRYEKTRNKRHRKTNEKLLGTEEDHRV